LKNIIFISFLLLFVVMCGIASAGMFGPTEPTAAPGKYSLGAGYFYDYTKWKTNGPDVRTESNQGYAQGSFAPTKNFDLFGRLGGADLKAEGKANTKLFGTLGGKAIFYQDNIAALGVFGQGTYHFEDYNTGVVKIKDYYDVQAGLSAQVKFQDFIIYGGGFWYYARAKGGHRSGQRNTLGKDSFRRLYGNENTLYEGGQSQCGRAV
jgi:hypothetical protein